MTRKLSASAVVILIKKPLHGVPDPFYTAALKADILIVHIPEKPKEPIEWIPNLKNAPDAKP